MSACRVLLRVRLLYYLKQEVIGSQAEKVFANVPARSDFLGPCSPRSPLLLTLSLSYLPLLLFCSEIDIPDPCADGDPPVFWWDKEADRSLLIGTFKHGEGSFLRYSVFCLWVNLQAAFALQVMRSTTACGQTPICAS